MKHRNCQENFLIIITCIGPAHYNLSGDISKNVKSGVICYAPREKKEDIKGPGPLHYHVSYCFYFTRE